MSVGSEVYTADGKLIGQYYKENRSPVELKNISPNLVNALIATEDVRFYKHNGVDFYSFFTSMLSTAKVSAAGAVPLHNSWPKTCLKPVNANRRALLNISR